MASLQDHLENLRAKPEHIRRRIAFTSALAFTLIIFAFWAASFTATVTGRPNVVSDVVAKVGSPGQSLVAAVGSLFYDFKDLVFGPKKVTYSSVIVTPGK